MQNLSYENEFDLHEKEPAGRTHFHLNSFARLARLRKTPFDIEAQGTSSEMAYSSGANFFICMNSRESNQNAFVFKTLYRLMTRRLSGRII